MAGEIRSNRLPSPNHSDRNYYFDTDATLHD